jgi:hypothetical protein
MWPGRNEQAGRQAGNSCQAAQPNRLSACMQQVLGCCLPQHSTAHPSPSTHPVVVVLRQQRLGSGLAAPRPLGAARGRLPPRQQLKCGRLRLLLLHEGHKVEGVVLAPAGRWCTGAGAAVSATRGSRLGVQWAVSSGASRHGRAAQQQSEAMPRRQRLLGELLVQTGRQAGVHTPGGALLGLAGLRALLPLSSRLQTQGATTRGNAGKGEHQASQASIQPRAWPWQPCCATG